VAAATDSSNSNSLAALGEFAERLVVEHPIATRVTQRPDGSIVCEPVEVLTRGMRGGRSSKAARAPDWALSAAEAGEDEEEAGGRQPPLIKRLTGHRLVRGMADCAEEVAVGGVVVCGALMGVVGLSTSLLRVISCVEDKQPVPVGAIAHQAMMASTAVAASVVAGTVGAPLVMALHAARLALRPALLAGSVALGVRWVKRHSIGAAGLLRKLQSGELSKQLDALRAIVHKAATCAAFRAEWARLAGVEVLLSYLAAALAAAQAAANAWADPTRAPVLPPGHKSVKSGGSGGGSRAGPAPSLLLGGLGSPGPALIARALAELCRDGDVVDTVLASGGVPLLCRAAAASLYGGSGGADAVAAAVAAALDPSAPPCPGSPGAGEEGEWSFVAHTPSESPAAGAGTSKAGLAALAPAAATGAAATKGGAAAAASTAATTTGASTPADGGSSGDITPARSSHGGGDAGIPARDTSAAGAAATPMVSASAVRAAAVAAGSPPALAAAAIEALARCGCGHAVVQQALAGEPVCAAVAVDMLHAGLRRGAVGAAPATAGPLYTLLALMHSIALEPRGKAALGAAGGVEALAGVLVLGAPRTAAATAVASDPARGGGSGGGGGKAPGLTAWDPCLLASAAATLHTVVRGDPTNMHALAATAPTGTAAALARASSALTRAHREGPAAGSSSGSGSGELHIPFGVPCALFGAHAGAGAGGGKKGGSSGHGGGHGGGGAMTSVMPPLRVVAADVAALANVIAA